MFKTYTFIQSSPAQTWTITHNLGLLPVCDIINASNQTIAPQSMRFIDSDTIEVTFSSATTGTARLAGKTVTIYPEVSGAGGVDTGAADVVKRFQDSISINNGLGGLIGVLGFESTAVPFEYHTIADAQDATSFPYLTNQVGYNGTKIDVGTAVSRANSTVPTRSTDVGDIRLGSHVNTTATDYLTGKVWFTGNSGDKIWVTAKTFNGVGGAYSVTVVVGPSATVGESYVIAGSATGTTGATQILSVTRLSNLTADGGGGGDGGGDDGSDPYWEDVSFLLDTTNLSDVTGNTSITNSNVTTSTSIYQVGNSSALFAGSTLKVAAGTSYFDFGSGDFTIEYWLYKNTSNTNVSIDFRDGNIDQLAPVLYSDNGTNLLYYVAAGVRINAQNALPSNDTWYFIALSRNSGLTKLYVNGTQVGDTYSDGSYYDNNRPLTVGDAAGGTVPFYGHMQELRITKGVGRYPNNFTPPTEVFPTN
jgi:hypothetical protein